MLKCLVKITAKHFYSNSHYNGFLEHLYFAVIKTIKRKCLRKTVITAVKINICIYKYCMSVWRHSTTNGPKAKRFFRVLIVSEHFSWEVIFVHQEMSAFRNDGTLTATILIGFSWNRKFEEIGLRLGLLFHFNILRHQLLVKMTVRKTVKNQSNLKLKTKHGFL